MEIYRAEYANAILVSFQGTPLMVAGNQWNIWNSLLLWRRLRFPRELVYINKTPLFILEVFKLPKIMRKDLLFKRDGIVTAPSLVTHWVQFLKFKRLFFKRKWWYRAGNLWTDIFLGVLTPGDDKNWAGRASFKRDNLSALAELSAKDNTETPSRNRLSFVNTFLIKVIIEALKI